MVKIYYIILDNMFFNSPVKNSIIIYLLVSFLILVKKPDIFFDANGELIEFGTQVHQSLFSFPIIIYLTAIATTFFFEYVSLKKI